MARNTGRRGALVLISMLLFSSAGVRAVVEAGPVLAADHRFGAAQAEESEPARPGGPMLKGDLDALLAALQRREADVERREVQIEDRLRALKMAENAVAKKLVELEEAEARLSGTLALAQTAAEDDLSRLTTVYEQMKPKEAALLFEEMEPEFAAGFLARMQPEAAAAVMAGMNPQFAYTVSVVVAGRNARVPKN